MKNGITTWFATAAFAGLAIAWSNAGTVVAQPPGFGPGGPDGPGRGGPPNVAELFSRMDKNNDGKLTEDEVPEPLWDRLSNADGDGDDGVTKDEAAKAMAGRRPDGARPEGGRPDGPPNDRPREEQFRSRDARPPMDRERDEASGQRDAGPERGRAQPRHSPDQPDRARSDRPDSAHRGPAQFGPDAFFDRLDKNGDGSLSRDEFHVGAAFHHGQQASHGPQHGPQGFSGHRGPGGDRGPSGPPMAHRGPDMRGGGPPWARDNFQGGPPWAHMGAGPQFHGRLAAPPWAQPGHDGDRHEGDRHEGDRHEGPRHHDAEYRDHYPRDEQRSPSRNPDHRDRTDANKPQSDAETTTTDESPSASPSDDSVTSSTPAESPNVATLPL